MNLEMGDLILVKGNGFIPNTIEKITKSPYSHVAGVVGNEKDKELIEAQGFQKTGFQSLSTYHGYADVFRCHGLTELQKKLIVAYVNKQRGTRYDYLLIIWELLRYVLNVVFPYIETKSYICSTLWNDAFQEAGVDLCPEVKYPSPGDLAKSLFLTKIGSL